MSTIPPWEWVVHVDLDSFYAAAEQLDKPTLRGKPVIVGGVGGRGVVATASYEARRYGVRSAMSTERARSLCPEGVFLPPRFTRYKQLSREVMAVLGEHARNLEPLSMDEAFLDLESGRGLPAAEAAGGDPVEVGRSIRRAVKERTGLNISVGVGKSKAVAKLASDQAKPDGLLVVLPEREEAFLEDLPVERLWGVGPVSGEKLTRVGIRTVGELARSDEAALVALLGAAAGRLLRQLANGKDPRKVESGRDTKSVSQETTFEADRSDRAGLERVLGQQATRVAERLQKSGLAGRTISVKLRYGDFRNLSRSLTFPGATDDPAEIVSAARRLLEEVDLSPGVRLLGVGVSGLGEVVQGVLPLYPVLEIEQEEESQEPSTHLAPDDLQQGVEVVHEVYGTGWVERVYDRWVDVRFETAESGPGPVKSFDRSMARFRARH